MSNDTADLAIASRSLMCLWGPSSRGRDRRPTSPIHNRPVEFSPQTLVLRHLQQICSIQGSYCFAMRVIQAVLGALSPPESRGLLSASSPTRSPHYTRGGGAREGS